MTDQDFFHRFLYALADIHGSLNLESTKDAVVRNAALLFGARGASLMLFDPGEESLKASASFGLSEAYRAKGSVSPRASLGETIKGAPVVVRDIAQDPNVQYRQAAIQEGIKAIVGMPLSPGGMLVGTLRLYFGEIKDFTSQEMEYLKALALQAGLALKKSFYFAAMEAATVEIHRVPSLDAIKDALKALVKTAAEYGHARGCALLLKNMATNTLA
jgi:GAF domain-containing protein